MARSRLVQKRIRTQKSPGANHRPKKSQAAKKAVRIRMYCQGLGDCFLLSFPADKPKFHMLIDCGVILGTPAGDDRMKEVVADIKEATGGVINLLVGTHEHWDH